jgi:hypothetical protein
MAARVAMAREGLAAPGRLNDGCMMRYALRQLRDSIDISRNCCTLAAELLGGGSQRQIHPLHPGCKIFRIADVVESHFHLLPIFFVPIAKAGTHFLNRKRDAKCRGHSRISFTKIRLEPKFTDLARKVSIQQAVLNICAYGANRSNRQGALVNILASGVIAVLASPTDSRQGSPVRRDYSLRPALPPQL